MVSASGHGGPGDRRSTVGTPISGACPQRGGPRKTTAVGGRVNEKHMDFSVSNKAKDSWFARCLQSDLREGSGADSRAGTGEKRGLAHLIIPPHQR